MEDCSQYSLEEYLTIKLESPLGSPPKWKNVIEAYNEANDIMWPQPPSPGAALADPNVPHIQHQGDAQSEPIALGGANMPFLFGVDGNANFDFAVPPGPAVSPTGVEVAPVQPAGPFLTVDAMGDLPWNSWYQWEFFFMDLIEVMNSGAGSFDEIWCRHLPPATNSPSSTTKLGPHTQENQTTLLHLLPTAVDIRSALDLLLVRSFPSHADDVVPPLSPRHSLKNGSKTFVRSATHTEACDVCTAAGKTSWHTPQQFKAHMEAHGPRQPCILCGKSLRNRYDAGTTHRHNGSCDVYNQLTARGDGLAALWAVIWGLREHKQWGRRDDIRDDEIDHIFGKP